MAKLIYGANARRLHQLTRPDETIATPLSAQELADLGIPARKIPRVQEEIARLALQDNCLLDRAVLQKLAGEIAKQLL